MQRKKLRKYIVSKKLLTEAHGVEYLKDSIIKKFLPYRDILNWEEFSKYIEKYYNTKDEWAANEIIRIVKCKNKKKTDEMLLDLSVEAFHKCASLLSVINRLYNDVYFFHFKETLAKYGYDFKKYYQREYFFKLIIMIEFITEGLISLRQDEKYTVIKQIEDNLMMQKLIKSIFDNYGNLLKRKMEIKEGEKQFLEAKSQLYGIIATSFYYENEMSNDKLNYFVEKSSNTKKWIDTVKEVKKIIDEHENGLRQEDAIRILIRRNTDKTIETEMKKGVTENQIITNVKRALTRY